jgi:hypothetical protein
MRDVLPTALYDEIARALRRRRDRGTKGWTAGEDEEDTLTGDLCGHLRSDWKRLRLGDAGLWRWRVTYKKFRSRSGRSAERALGADGIIQIEVIDLVTDELYRKGLLFQAKRRSMHRDARLLNQVRQMEALVPGN